jgi:CRP/FNR family cyclic AMP-dependent transcriptional regulator
MAMGDLSGEVLLVESGVVKVLLRTANGLDVLTGLLGPGALLGESGVLGSCRRSATVIGHRDGIATHVPARTFRDLASGDQDVRALADATQRQRLLNADRRQLTLASADVRARMAAQLLDWVQVVGERTEDGYAIRGLSHRDLAAAVLASEKHVDAVLAELRAAGLLRTGRMSFFLTDLPGLVRLAG